MDLSHEQEQFLDRAVEGLAQDGKIICVRLALFADMLKGKPWTTATLTKRGRDRGAGRDVPGGDVQCPHCTGRPSPSPEGGPGGPQEPCCLRPVATSRAADNRTSSCLEASGYARRPEDFRDLIQILDSEIRLITPTVPEGEDDDHGTPVDSPELQRRLRNRVPSRKSTIS